MMMVMTKLFLFFFSFFSCSVSLRIDVIRQRNKASSIMRIDQPSQGNNSHTHKLWALIIRKIIATNCRLEKADRKRGLILFFFSFCFQSIVERRARIVYLCSNDQFCLFHAYEQTRLVLSRSPRHLRPFSDLHCLHTPSSNVSHQGDTLFASEDGWSLFFFRAELIRNNPTCGIKYSQLNFIFLFSGILAACALSVIANFPVSILFTPSSSLLMSFLFFSRCILFISIACQCLCRSSDCHVYHINYQCGSCLLWNALILLDSTSFIFTSISAFCANRTHRDLYVGIDCM